MARAPPRVGVAGPRVASRCLPVAFMGRLSVEDGGAEEHREPDGRGISPGDLKCNAGPGPGGGAQQPAASLEGVIAFGLYYVLCGYDLSSYLSFYYTKSALALALPRFVARKLPPERDVHSCSALLLRGEVADVADARVPEADQAHDQLRERGEDVEHEVARVGAHLLV